MCCEKMSNTVHTILESNQHKKCIHKWINSSLFFCTCFCKKYCHCHSLLDKYSFLICEFFSGHFELFSPSFCRFIEAKWTKAKFMQCNDHTISDTKNHWRWFKWSKEFNCRRKAHLPIIVSHEWKWMRFKWKREWTFDETMNCNYLLNFDNHLKLYSCYFIIFDLNLFFNGIIIFFWNKLQFLNLNNLYTLFVN